MERPSQPYIGELCCVSASLSQCSAYGPLPRQTELSSLSYRTTLRKIPTTQEVIVPAMTEAGVRAQCLTRDSGLSAKPWDSLPSTSLSWRTELWTYSYTNPLVLFRLVSRDVQLISRKRSSLSTLSKPRERSALSMLSDLIYSSLGRRDGMRKESNALKRISFKKPTQTQSNGDRVSCSAAKRIPTRKVMLVLSEFSSIWSGILKKHVTVKRHMRSEARFPSSTPTSVSGCEEDKKVQGSKN